LRRAHWFRHPEEDHDTLSAAPGWERFVGNAQAAINLLPIVHDPNVARWADGKIGLHLQTSANVAAGAEIWSPVFIPGGQISVRTRRAR